jgi:ankyrin repeat protein
MLQFGKTALMYASEKGHTATVQALIGAGADLNVYDQVRDRCFHVPVD